MSKQLILSIIAVTLCFSCRDIKVKNETQIHYHKDINFTIKGEIDNNEIDLATRKESSHQQLEDQASTEKNS